MSWQLLDWGILLPALAAGALVLLTHVPLGREVLSRGIIFIDLAVAQVAALGVIAAGFLGWDENRYLLQLVVVISALGAALLLRGLERRFSNIQEAMIGVTFVLAATLGMLLLAHDPHAGEQLKELLAGQILWVDWSMLEEAAFATLLVLVLWRALPARMAALRFYLVFALAVTVSVQLVGVYLVFASLIIPALLIRHRRGKSALALGYLIGMGGYLGGLLGSALFDLPSGPLIVWALAILALFFGMVAGRYFPSSRESL